MGTPRLRRRWSLLEWVRVCFTEIEVETDRWHINKIPALRGKSLEESVLSMAEHILRHMGQCVLLGKCQMLTEPRACGLGFGNGDLSCSAWGVLGELKEE